MANAALQGLPTRAGEASKGEGEPAQLAALSRVRGC